MPLSGLGRRPLPPLTEAYMLAAMRERIGWALATMGSALMGISIPLENHLVFAAGVIILASTYFALKKEP